MFCFLKASAVVSATDVIERQSSFLHFGQMRPEQSNTVSASTVSMFPQAAHPSVTLNLILLPPMLPLIMPNMCSELNYTSALKDNTGRYFAIPACFG